MLAYIGRLCAAIAALERLPSDDPRSHWWFMPLLGVSGVLVGLGLALFPKPWVWALLVGGLVVALVVVRADDEGWWQATR